MLSGGETKRVAHMPPMSRKVPRKGRATMAALVLSRTEVKRKIRPARPAISVCPNRCVWLVWMSKGVRIVIFASLEICPRSISFSPPASPCCMPVMGRSGARLAWTAAGDTPTVVTPARMQRGHRSRSRAGRACRRSFRSRAAAIAGSHSWRRLLVVDDELRGHDVAGIARLGDGNAWLCVGEDRPVGVAEAILEPQIDPVEMVSRARVGHAGRAQVWNQLRQVEDGRERE